MINKVGTDTRLLQGFHADAWPNSVKSTWRERKKGARFESEARELEAWKSLVSVDAKSLGVSGSEKQRRIPCYLQEKQPITTNVIHSD